MISVLLAAVLAAPPVPYALVIPDSGDLPIVVDVDFAQVARAWGLSGFRGPVSRGDVRTAIEVGGKLMPVPCQYDPSSPTAGTLTLLPPPNGAAVRVYFTAGAPIDAAPAPRASVTVSRRGQGFVIDNGHVRILHDPTRQAGLPSSLTFIAANKTLDAFRMNDRVHHRELGSFWLRQCPEAKVTLAAAGPLRAAVRIEAYYAADSRTPDSKPSAVYEFSYFAGSPWILVRAWVRQEQSFAWNELHILEWNFPGTEFTQWATDKSPSPQPLKAERRTHSGSQWGALTDGRCVLGIAGSKVLIYDGRGGYGTYVHGPWVQWGERTAEFMVWVYATSSPGALAALAERPAPKLTKATITAPPFEAALRKLASRGDLWAWVADLCRRLARQGCLGEAADIARAALARPATDAAARSFMAEKGWGYFVRTDRLGFMLSPELHDGTGGWEMSLYDFAARRDLMAVGQRPVWAIEAELGDQTWSADSLAKPSSVQLAGNELRITWRLRPPQSPGPITVTFRAMPGRAGQIWLDLLVDNRSNWSIANIAWPYLWLGELPGGGADTLLMPLCSGKLIRDPYAYSLPRGSLYPNGWTDMQVFALYDSGGGAVVMCQDPLASMKRFVAQGHAADHCVQLGFDWPAPDHTRPGNDFDPPGRIAIAPLAAGQDWYDAAMIYRAWVSSGAQWWPDRGRPGRSDTADWLRDMPVWIVYGGRPETVVKQCIKFRRFMGVPCALHWYNWHQIPFDNDYPHYFPTKPGFAEGVRQLQQAGVRVMPYINGRLWDSDTDDFLSRAFPWCTKDRNGKYYIEIYGSGEKLVPMCPTTKLWQDTVRGIVLRLVGPEFNVDGVYIDQIAAASPRLCYDPGHGHPLGGGYWWTAGGYWPMLTKIRKQMHARYRDKILTSECTAECYSHVLDGLLSWHWQENNAVPFFTAVYNDKIVTFSRAYRYRQNKALTFRMRMAQQFVFGDELGWINPSVVDDPDCGPYLRTLARMRWRLREFYRGRVLRPPVLLGTVPKVTMDWAWHSDSIVTLPVVQVGAFRSLDGRIAVVATNFSDVPISVRLKLHGREWGLKPGAKLRWVDASGPSTLPGDFTVPLHLDARTAIAVVIEP